MQQMEASVACSVMYASCTCDHCADSCHGYGYGHPHLRQPTTDAVTNGRHRQHHLSASWPVCPSRTPASRVLLRGASRSMGTHGVYPGCSQRSEYEVLRSDHVPPAWLSQKFSPLILDVVPSLSAGTWEHCSCCCLSLQGGP